MNTKLLALSVLIFISGCASHNNKATSFATIKSQEQNYINQFSYAALPHKAQSGFPDRPWLSQHSIVALTQTMESVAHNGDVLKRTQSQQTIQRDSHGLYRIKDIFTANEQALRLRFSLNYMGLLAIDTQELSLTPQTLDYDAVIGQSHVTNTNFAQTTDFELFFKHGSRQHTTTEDFKEQCHLTAEGEAQQLHSQLMGSFREFSCETYEQNVLSQRLKMAYLPEYDFFVLRESQWSNGTVHYRVTDVKIE